MPEIPIDNLFPKPGDDPVFDLHERIAELEAERDKLKAEIEELKANLDGITRLMSDES